MKALTLRHPWPFLVAFCGKDVENRDWSDAYADLCGLPELIGQDVVIHGGAAPVRPRRARPVCNLASTNLWREHCEGLDWVRGVLPELPGPALAYLTQRCPDGVLTREAFVLTGCAAVARLGEPTRASRSRWAVPGALHLPLLDVRPLPQPVACPGAQGLWTLPEVIEREVVRQLQPRAPLGSWEQVRRIWGD